jgi:hypothetical protein
MLENIFDKFKPEEKIELQIQKQQQVEKVLMGKIIPHNNHTVWEICLKTEKIQKATYVEKEQVINFGQEPEKENTEVLYREGFAYVSALNKKNAMKKFRQNKNGSKEFLKEPLKIKLF